MRTHWHNDFCSFIVRIGRLHIQRINHSPLLRSAVQRCTASRRTPVVRALHMTKQGKKWWALLLSTIAFMTLVATILSAVWPVQLGKEYEVAFGNIQRARQTGRDVTHIDVVVPVWGAAIVFGAAAVLLWYRIYRSYPVGHCNACGYDLTGNASGRCPECGTPVRH